MTSAVLLKLYQINHYAATKNLDGFTHEESLKSPDPGGNCVNWILGHLVVSRNAILNLLEAEPVEFPGDATVYQRGSSGLAGKETAFPKLLEAFNLSQERIEAALKAVPESRFAGLVMTEDLGGNIAFLQFHEGYHIGQLGLLRRIVGKPGAIR